MNILSLLFAASAVAAAPITVPLPIAQFKHITFSGIPPTSYADGPDGTLVIKVARSASFLLQPFEAPRRVLSIAFKWRSEGALLVPDAAAEATKAGDDARLRIGLLLAGDAPTVPFFAPAWIKAIRDDMKVPSGRMLYLVVDARHAAGTRWPSPHSSSMELVALSSRPLPDQPGWQEAKFDAGEPLAVVGLWIMADGDDTASTFTTTVKDLAMTLKD